MGADQNFPFLSFVKGNIVDQIEDQKQQLHWLRQASSLGKFQTSSSQVDMDQMTWSINYVARSIARLY